MVGTPPGLAYINDDNAKSRFIGLELFCHDQSKTSTAVQ